MANKPTNWYAMSYQERQTWERQQREKEDIEYEKLRAEENLENAQRTHKRALEAARYESESQREELSQLREEYDNAVAQAKRAEQFIRENKLWDAYQKSDLSVETYSDEDDKE